MISSSFFFSAVHYYQSSLFLLFLPFTPPEVFIIVLSVLSLLSATVITFCFSSGTYFLVLYYGSSVLCLFFVYGER